MSQQSTSSSSSALAEIFHKHRNAILIALGATVLTGSAVYYYSKTSADDDDKPSPEKEKKKNKKKNKKKSQANKAANKSDDSSANNNQQQQQKDDSVQEYLNLSLEEIEALPSKRREEIATQLKVKGNQAYSARSYQEAIKYYTKAIDCHEEAVFYSNRAACNTNIGDTEATIRDCNEALRLDPTYIKALHRRGSAKELQGTETSLWESLCDYTSSAILDGFANQSNANSVERVMKKLAQAKATRIMKERTPRIPSPTFVKAYLEAFQKKSKIEVDENSPEGDVTVSKAFEAMDNMDFKTAQELFDKAPEQTFSSPSIQARAYNMRGTFRFIMGNPRDSLQDLDRSTELDPNFVQTWVKKASVFMELGDSTAAFKAFEDAIAHDAQDPDIYYHRGQVYFITNQFDDAIADYQKSISIEPNFTLSQIQLAVTHYKKEQVDKAINLFKKCLQTFGESSCEVHNYYGELLLDQGKFDEAIKSFDKAIELEKKKPQPQNVLPMVNKALALFQSKQAFEPALELCYQALEIDSGCDVAIATLAQLLMQQNKLQEAIDMFGKSVEAARTEAELINALAYENATKAQVEFIKNFPEHAARLGLSSK